MILEVFIAILIGITLGIITGLTPGVHINLVAVLALTSFPILSEYFSVLSVIIALISMAVAHTFLDFIPSVYLGVPDSDTSLSVFPSHRLLFEGDGHEAVQLATLGSLFGLVITIFMTPVLIISVRNFYPVIKQYIPLILILSSSFLILRDRDRKWSLIEFLLSGVLGLGVLSLDLSQPLFPLFSGMFGISTLLMSLKNNTNLPTQNIKDLSIDNKETFKALGGGFIASSLAGFLPGLGSAQAAIIASNITGKLSSRGFIVLIGSINTIVMIISFIALYVIDRARNGVIVVVSKIGGVVDMNHLILFLGVSFIVAGLSTFLTLELSKLFSRVVSKIDYKKVSILIIILIISLVTFITGLLGLFVLTVSTFVGLIPMLKNTGRSHLMGSLIIPVILYLLL
ncbi:tripartite tricarboxylate transporter permease [Candidatus Woesearchaeota archaeon]|nr:tripartite tricarboxylate transporter permease [Candidatus Woesearchaeota archaeon]